MHNLWFVPLISFDRKLENSYQNRACSILPNWTRVAVEKPVHITTHLIEHLNVQVVGLLDLQKKYRIKCIQQCQRGIQPARPPQLETSMATGLLPSDSKLTLWLCILSNKAPQKIEISIPARMMTIYCSMFLWVTPQKHHVHLQWMIKYQKCPKA